MKTKIEKVKGKLQRAVERLTNAGGFLNSGHYVGVHVDGVPHDLIGTCLLGSTLVGGERDRSVDYVVEAARKLGIDPEDAKEIEHGYQYGDDDGGDLYRLGAEMRREFFETTDEVVS